MKHDQVLRIGSLPTKKKVSDAAKHNLRELPPEPHIDPQRSHLNRILYGAATSKEVERQARTAWNGVKKIRKNAIHGVEVLVCLPYTYTGDAMAFFNDALAWADEFFQVPVLSAIAHFDEPAPHMHIILLPIIDGELQGSKVMGDLKRIQAMQNDFYASVGRKYGLRRKTAQKRPIADRRNAAMQIMDALAANPALLSGGMIRHMLLEAVAQNPEPYAASLNMPMPEPKANPSKQTFVGIMTKPQRPERKKTPIGHLHVVGMPEASTKKQKSYALVGDCDSLPVELPVIGRSIDLREVHDAEPQLVNDDDFERVRDGEIGADCWDADRGEFIPMPPKASRKAQVQHAVRVALSAVGRFR